MYPIIYKRVTDNKELREILELQKRNVSSSISEEEKEGFVTVYHDFKNSLILLTLLLCFNCADNTPLPFQDGKSTIFTSIPQSHSKIDFKNLVEEDVDFNFLNYTYIYNGGGVAVGDINNDGLEDVYFTSNQKSNKLYINKGNFVFEDITEKARVEDNEGWTTGVTMVDINNDGWLDIYVCKSGSLNNRKARQNKLYINQKNNKFKEEAIKYGLKEYSFSTQAYFLDYDRDGDLDLYLVNHSTDSNSKLLLKPQQQASLKIDSKDRLYRNDNGIYKDVTRTSGISNIKAWGLSASIGDFNNDSWPDIYVANDFLEPDCLYINNTDGTFTDAILTRFKHISTNSMGSDYADINNDLLPDLIVLDMMAADRKRGKENMATMNTAKFNRLVNKGYHHQYMSNMLQLNYGNGAFSEIGQFAGIAKTDWSWAPLVTDFNNDGFNDIFITNGIQRDLSNQDFRNTIGKKNITDLKEADLEKAIRLIPSVKLANYMFINNKDFTFNNLSNDYGFDTKINSNGAAYADFDNDGDFDLVLNNQSDKATIYRNNTKANYISIDFIGPHKNVNGIGAKVKLYTKKTQQIKEVYTSRGYQSSVSYTMIFGVGESNSVDSLRVLWPDGKTQSLTNIDSNKKIALNYVDAKDGVTTTNKADTLFDEISAASLGISYKHHAVNFNDYNLQLLLPQKQTTIDNALTVADVNNDGLDDVFIGNTMGFPAALYIQNNSGTFVKTNQELFEKEKAYNDNNGLFFDADKDGDLDLYIASGNYSQPENSVLLQDRLYINDGKGHFSIGKLPKMLSVTKAVTASDIDNDGDQDLFIGGRVVSGKYPNAPTSYLLENRNGNFINATSKRAKGLASVGLVNDATFSDYDNDGDNDLILAGEWMPISFFNNNNGVFTKVDLPTNQKTGWFQTIKVIDYDTDGDADYFVGNFGKNNKFHPTEKKPLHIYANNFDANGSYDIALSKESEGQLFPIRGKECSAQQTPYLNEKMETFSEFANSNIMDVYGKENIESALHLEASSFDSYYIQNNGNGSFEFIPLPNQAQFGPTLDFEFLDLNKDGILEVLGVGGVYDAEVETIRYDASQGYILTRNNDNNISMYKDLIPLTNKEVKAIESILIKGELHLLLMHVNETLSILKVKQ